MLLSLNLIVLSSLQNSSTWWNLPGLDGDVRYELGFATCSKRAKLFKLVDLYKRLWNFPANGSFVNRGGFIYYIKGNWYSFWWTSCKVLGILNTFPSEIVFTIHQDLFFFQCYFLCLKASDLTLENQNLVLHFREKGHKSLAMDPLKSRQGLP